jgi:hypothetical protein
MRKSIHVECPLTGCRWRYVMCSLLLLAAMCNLRSPQMAPPEERPRCTHALHRHFRCSAQTPTVDVHLSTRVLEVWLANCCSYRPPTLTV